MITVRLWAHVFQYIDNYDIFFPFALIFGTPFTALADLFMYVIAKNADLKKNTWLNNSRPLWKKLLANSFRPLADLSKNLLDTFKPYKYGFKFEFTRALSQPFQGFANICTGVFRAVTAPIAAVLVLVIGAFAIIGNPSAYQARLNFMAKALGNLIPAAINGVMRILTGAVQLALTPFSWFVKPLIRIAVSALIKANDESPMIEKNDGIQYRLKVAERQQGDDLCNTYSDIHRKLLLCKERGENTCIDMSEAGTKITTLNIKGVDQLSINTLANAYRSLFLAKPQIEATSVVSQSSSSITYTPGVTPV